MTQSRIHTLVAAATLASLVAAADAGAGFLYTDIADITGSFDPISTARLNDSGTVVFRTRTLVGGAEVRTIFTGNGGALTTIAQSTASTTASPTSLGFPTIANNGTVQYSTIDGFSPGADRRLVQSNGGTDTIVFGLNSQAAFTGVIPGNSISDNGQHTVFEVGLTGGGTGIRSGDGTPGGPFTTIAGPTTGFTQFGSQPSINNSGVAAFEADNTGTGVGGSIFAGNGGALTTIAESGTTTVGSETIAFVGTEPVINNNGDVAFVALFTGFTDGGYFIGNGGALTTVLKFSDLTEAVNGVGSPDLNDSGMTAFWMSFGGGLEGIFSGPDLINDKIIATGDALFGSTVTDVEFFRGLNNNGQVAFGVALADGSKHIVRADLMVVSEPATALLFAIGVAGLGLRRRSRTR